MQEYHRLIGLTGRKRSGKSTAAECYVDDAHFAEVQIAGPIKNGLELMFGLSPRHFTDPVLKEQPMPGFDVSPRVAAQTLGTEWGRELFGEDVWIKLAMIRASGLLRRHYNGVVFSDVRFDNEADMIRKAGGIIIEVLRPGLDDQDAHRSEAGLSPDRIDASIINDSDIEHLKATAWRLLWL